MFTRKLKIDPKLPQTVFLWGPRQTGKSTLIRNTFPDLTYIDLLKTDEMIRYTTTPSLLREELIASQDKKIIIDEIQKVPDLLNEVHWLIENQNVRFVLCGSSARKLKREHANLLGGRALRYELFGLIAEEIGNEFSLNTALNHGYLPRHYLTSQPNRMLQSYVANYLKEEIAAKGLVRNLPLFSNFLSSAALSDTEIINYSTIARDCGISAPTIKEYFQILQDTLIGSLLPAFTKCPKRRIIASPKFYFFDVGLVNFLNKRGTLKPGSELYGKAFENWLHHELKAHSQYTDLFYELSYWKLANGAEVDFIINDMIVAIECKATQNIKSDHLKNLRILKEEHPHVQKRIVVCLDTKARKTEDGIEILPALEFIKRLWNGEIIS